MNTTVKFAKDKKRRLKRQVPIQLIYFMIKMKQTMKIEKLKCKLMILKNLGKRSTNKLLKIENRLDKGSRKHM